MLSIDPDVTVLVTVAEMAAMQVTANVAERYDIDPIALLDAIRRHRTDQ